jgi:hypothetical protein
LGKLCGFKKPYKQTKFAGLVWQAAFFALQAAATFALQAIQSQFLAWQCRFSPAGGGLLLFVSRRAFAGALWALGVRILKPRC